MSDNTPTPAMTRRSFLQTMARSALVVGIGGLAGTAFGLSRRREYVWQIDPFKCIQCGRCATHCVLDESAVKCVHDMDMCGYCKICTGYLRSGYAEVNEGAENQLCPVNAIRRRFVEGPYFEYTIDESLCIGCGQCVKGCNAFGNGSLYLQVRHDRCLNCNDCSIARQCASNAFIRLPADRPYIVKHLGKVEP